MCLKKNPLKAKLKSLIFHSSVSTAVGETYLLFAVNFNVAIYFVEDFAIFPR